MQPKMAAMNSNGTSSWNRSARGQTKMRLGFFHCSGWASASRWQRTSLKARPYHTLRGFFDQRLSTSRLA